MNKLLHEFAELVGRCLARRWLREADDARRENTRPQTPTHQSATEAGEASPRRAGPIQANRDPLPKQ